MRLALESDTSFVLRAPGIDEHFALEASGAWDEWELELPPGVPDARVRIELETRGARFTALHYWAYRRPD